MMTGPIIIAHHLIWTGYGWWLPNDPRGSNSTCIASDIIAELGELHHRRKRVRPAFSTVRNFYERAQAMLKFELLTLSREERTIIGEALAQCIRRNRYTCYACAVLPTHVHMLIRRHRDHAEDMIGVFQERSRLALQKGKHGGHPIWGGPGWKVFLETPGDIRRTIRYIQQNPVKIGLQAQRWNFVTRYDGWPHPKRR